MFCPLNEKVFMEEKKEIKRNRVVVYCNLYRLIACLDCVCYGFLAYQSKITVNFTKLQFVALAERVFMGLAAAETNTS
jgi:hypothetical protein